MGYQNSTNMGKIIDIFRLQVLNGGVNCRNVRITADEMNRVGFQLATESYEHFDTNRIQIVGAAEASYIEGLSHNDRLRKFEALLSRPIPALVYCRNIQPTPECLEVARKYNRPILQSDQLTGEFTSTLVASLKVYLSPCITRHGVLMEVYGEGVFIIGESGVGKSETAIELIKRGHRLIADDAVEIKRITAKRLQGSAPELIRHYIELRGIGVVDVCRLFGMSAVKDQQDIDMVVNFEPWKDGAQYDRLGLENFYTNILDIDVPTITIPVKPGRNLAVILEVAAMNNRNKKMGFNAAEEFTKRLNDHFNEQVGGTQF